MKVDIKTKAQIDRMREACRMSAEIRDMCAAAVAPGVTTGEIDDIVAAYCEKHTVGASFYQFKGGRGIPDFPGHLCVSINDEVIHDRIAGRRTCPKCKAGYHVKALPPKVEGICDKCGAELVIRKDDNPDTVKDRLVVYHRETEPLIKYYEEKGLLRRIDGDQGPVKNAAAFLAAM